MRAGAGLPLPWLCKLLWGDPLPPKFLVGPVIPRPPRTCPLVGVDERDRMRGPVWRGPVEGVGVPCVSLGGLGAVRRWGVASRSFVELRV